MPKFRPSRLMVIPALLSVACPQSEAQRGRDALKKVAALHRELHDCHCRHAQAFAKTPEGAQARTAPLWPQCPLADVDGLLISKALLKGYMDLETRSAPRDLPANARSYLERRAALAQAEAEALERAAPVDPASVPGKVRAASLAMWREDGAIVRNYLAAMAP